jgi:hypothetical protein
MPPFGLTKNTLVRTHKKQPRVESEAGLYPTSHPPSSCCEMMRVSMATIFRASCNHDNNEMPPSVECPLAVAF